VASTDSQYKQKVSSKTRMSASKLSPGSEWSPFCCQVITDIALWLWPSRFCWRTDWDPFAFLAKILLERFACFLLAAAAHL